MNFVKSIIHGRDDYSPKVKKFLHEYGDVPIDTIEIFRTPLTAFYSLRGNLLSHGRLKYEKLLFHLGLKSGKVLTVEKNEVINVDYFKPKPKLQLMKVNVQFANLTINELLNKTKALMGVKFYKYQAGDNNYQYFAMSVLKANHLLKPEYQNFIMQSVKHLFENQIARLLTNTITDIGGRKDVVVQGGFIKRCSFK